jgi:hypothetical protein
LRLQLIRPGSEITMASRAKKTFRRRGIHRRRSKFDIEPTLSAPFVCEALGEILDLDSLSADGATVVIEPYRDRAEGDLVAFVWLGLATGSSTGELRQVKARDLGRRLELSFDPLFVRAARGRCVLSYRVQRVGGELLASEQLSLTVEQFAC